MGTTSSHPARASGVEAQAGCSAQRQPANPDPVLGQHHDGARLQVALDVSQIRKKNSNLLLGDTTTPPEQDETRTERLTGCQQLTEVGIGRHQHP